MHSNLRRIAIRVLAVLLVSLFFCSTALASRTATVNCSSLSVRAQASSSAKKLGALPYGTKVTVLATSGGWAKISYKGYTGYAASVYLTTASTAKRIKAYVVRNAPVYRSASTSSKKLGTAPKGAAVYVVGKKGGYYRVQNASGTKSGYMTANSLSRSKPSTASTAKLSKAQRLIAGAKTLKGKPYALANAGPGCFDCSGFTYYCYKKVGVRLSGSAKAQGYNNGVKVTKAQLRAGDIVCFNTNPDDSDLCDHVGIYLGNGNFIHASSVAGKVIISSMKSGYYASVFSWGRRVL